MKGSAASILVLGLAGAGGVAGFNASNFPRDQVFYYSQWAVYGPKGPPSNKVTSANDPGLGGTYAGRYFYLEDFVAKSNEFYAPGATKVINFSFGGIDMDTCDIMSVDFWADMMIGAGTQLGRCGSKGAGYTGASPWDAENGSDDCATGLACSLRGLKQKQSGWKIALSVGGWTMSTEFARCARDSGKRAKLVRSLGWFVEQYALDIIDIDWEYPSKAGCDGSKADPCKMVISRGKTYSPDMKGENDECDKGAVYKLRGQLNAWPKLLALIDNHNVIGQAVNTEEGCKAFHHPAWRGIPTGKEGVSKYWAGSLTNKDWVNYVQLLQDFADGSHGGKKLAVTTAVGMDPCLSTGSTAGQKCSHVANWRMEPSHPKGQGTSLRAFCKVQHDSGGFVNTMTYDYFGNWSPPYHNAPLFDNPRLRGKEGYHYEMNVDLSLRNWLTKAYGGVQNTSDGCTPEQMNLGIPLYGRTFKDAGAFGKFGPKKSSQTLGVGTYQAGVVSLYDVRHRFLSNADGGNCGGAWGSEHCGKWKLKRDVYAGCVPWLEKPGANGLDIISFDDDHSLKLKAKWGRCMGFNGLLYWDAADDQDAKGSRASWEGWAAVSKSECAKILLPPTSCPGMPGEQICFGEVGDKCTGGGGGGGGVVTPEPEIPEPEIPEPEIPEPEIPEPEGPGGAGVCGEYAECLEGCLGHLSG